VCIISFIGGRLSARGGGLVGSRGDRYGFGFWLGWILCFAGSFLVAFVLWTVVVNLLFGRVVRPEITASWAVAVFGTWFILIIPFMRKKEEIWKRLNPDEERAADLWLRSMGLLVGLIIVSFVFWTWKFKDRILQGSPGDWDPLWAKAVFATVLILFLPFLIWMYRKADEIFKTAASRQRPGSGRHRSILVEKPLRLLSPELTDKLRKTPYTLPGAHVVAVRLKDGRKISHVFVRDACEVLGVYDRVEPGFVAGEVVDIECMDPADLPAYQETRWLRLDGVR